MDYRREALYFVSQKTIFRDYLIFNLKKKKNFFHYPIWDPKTLDVRLSVCPSVCPEHFLNIEMGHGQYLEGRYNF